MLKAANKKHWNHLTVYSFVLFLNFQKASNKPSIIIHPFSKPRLAANKLNMKAWDSKTLREMKYDCSSRGLKYIT